MARETKIILHCADLNPLIGFNIVNEVDYDIIGISYYPMYHGK